MNIHLKTNQYMIKKITKKNEKHGRVLIPKRFMNKNVMVLLTKQYNIRDNTNESIIQAEIITIRTYENVKYKYFCHYPIEYVNYEVIILPLDSDYTLNITP